MKVRVEIAVDTDVGRVRSENQDHYCVFDPEDPEQIRSKGSFVVVADGMGGHTGGTVASHTAIDAMYESFSTSQAESMHELVESAINSGNSAVRQKAQSNPQIKDMGTTCVCLQIRGKHVLIAHLGDSRCYMFRGNTAEIVTRDHTYLNELVDIGLLTAEQAEGHPDKNIITRCVGMSATLDIDYNRREAQPGDIFAMCSDGLSNFVTTDEIFEEVKASSAEDACKNLIELANSRGGDDNITVAVVKVHEIPEVNEDLARLDEVESNYSSKMTPVINREELGPELSPVDPDADTAEGLKPPPTDDEETEVGERRRPSSNQRSNLAWYWLIGAEVVLFVLLQVVIGLY